MNELTERELEIQTLFIEFKANPEARSQIRERCIEMGVTRDEVDKFYYGKIS